MQARGSFLEVQGVNFSASGDLKSMKTVIGFRMEVRDRNLEDILVQKWSNFDRGAPRFERGAPRFERGGPGWSAAGGPAAEAESPETERAWRIRKRI